jgi:hypothetical protein
MRIGGSCRQGLGKVIARIVREPEFVRQFHTLGMTNSTGAGTPQSVAAFMRSERENWDKILDGLDIKPQ